MKNGNLAHLCSELSCWLIINFNGCHLMISTIMTDSITSLLTLQDKSGIHQHLLQTTSNTTACFPTSKPVKLMDIRQYGLMRKLLYFSFFSMQKMEESWKEGKRKFVCWGNRVYLLQAASPAFSCAGASSHPTSL